MSAMHYDGKHFRPVANTSNGHVNGGTLFQYRQEGDLLTATYRGGGVRFGQIVGRVLAGAALEFRYQHITEAGSLCSGWCESTPERLPDGRIRLHERWRWTSGDLSTGQSVVEEVAG